MSLIFSKPGSMTAYSTAVRQGLPFTSDCPPSVSPASYDIKTGISKCPEIVAPFHTSEERGKIKPNGFPGPNHYSPKKKDRVEIGTPGMLWGDRFPPQKYCSLGAGPAYGILDSFTKMVLENFHYNNTKRPRVQFEKFVSNNVPTVFNTLDMKDFIQGGDGRMYPWWRNRPKTGPGPKYNVGGIYTSKSYGPYIVNFGNMATRKPLFEERPGFGPADFDTRFPLNPNGGVFLSKTKYNDQSIPRFFDVIIKKAATEIYPHPLEYKPKGSFDQMSPKAVSAPFKSKVPVLGFPKREVGPGPADHFLKTMTIDDVYPPVFPYSLTCPPEKAPFDTSAERFFDMDIFEQCSRPAPCDYTLMGFTDEMNYKLVRHAAAVKNPKLGFLSSAPARPDFVFATTETLSTIDHMNEPCPPQRQWRNLRPRHPSNYPFHGTGTRCPDSPGPIYDTAPAVKAIKGQKSWWNPREFNGTGFGNSGCGRKIELNDLDKDNPGPIYMVPSFFPGPGGGINFTEERFKKPPSVGPGPRHKAHEKCESMWRATQLGTYNVYLKGIGALHPNSGGYQPYGPIDALGDCVQGFDRIDEYKNELVNSHNFGN